MLLRKISIAVSYNTYRIFWNDGTYERIEGLNFFHAFFDVKSYNTFDLQALLCWEEI